MEKQLLLDYELIPETQYIHLRFDHHPKGVIYNIPISELGQLLPKSYPLSEQFPNRSHWMTHLAKTKPVSRKWLNSLQELIQELVPDNKINWDSTNHYLDSLKS